MSLRDFKKLLSIIFVLTLLTGPIFSSTDSTLDILENDEAKFIFKLKPFEIYFEEKYVDGVRYEIPAIAGYGSLVEPGKPLLPVKGLLIGIPDHTLPEIKILEFRTILVGVKNLLPAPRYLIQQSEHGQFLQDIYTIDKNFYPLNRFYPTAVAEIKDINSARGQTIARLEIHPLQYNPATGELLKVEQLTIALYFNQQQPDKTSTFDSPSFNKSNPYDNFLQKMLVNYQPAKTWRHTVKRQSVLRKNIDTWRSSNATYFKLFVDQSGIYRLDFSYLTNLGIDLNPIDPGTFKIFNKGQEIPLLVRGEDDGRFDADDYLEFYGQKNCTDGADADPYADTNVYWLTWEGEHGLRYHRTTSISDQPHVVPDYIEKIHLEQDRIYYYGFSDYQVHNTELVEGEGWIWRYFYAGERETIPLPLTFFAQNGYPAKISIKLRGTTVDPISPNHHVQVTLNDSLLGDFYFDDVTDYWFVTIVRNLNDGENKLVIKSMGDTGAQLDQFYLDWVKLEYPRQLIAMSDKLEFILPENNDKISQATVWGFTDPEIRVFNLTANAVLENAQCNSGKRVTLHAVSAGYNDGNYAKIFVDNEPVIPSGKRGHNIAVIDETTGEVVDIQYFDTYASTADADNMANYLQNLPAGKIVLAAIRDEGSARMTENAYQALESLGSKLTRHVKSRDSWAMIGRKGALIGEVVEQLTTRGNGIAGVQDTVIVPGKGTNFYVTFQDSIQSTQTYIAVSQNGCFIPKAATLDTLAELTATTNGADLIIISHKKFFNSALELGAYRASRNNLRVKIVDVEDIYDEFNYGILSPQAIKDFLTYAYSSWQSPPPSYVIFFGDASLDFKKNSGESSKVNYVPSYGNPVSDNWYVCFDGADDFLPEMFAGRIPVETAEQAEIVIDKIIAYENTPSAGWKKDLLFITGGFDDIEQSQFMYQSNFLIRNYVLPPPASCRALQINKTTEGYFEGEKKEEVLAAMNNGLLWVNFVGHAGSRTWDLMFSHPDIEELDNEHKYPFITSMTCHTGRFADPEQDSFGEHFLLSDRKGAIAFWGTTGWGYVFQDNVLLKNIFKATMVDTMHGLGPATTYAKFKLWEGYGGGIYNINTIHQYTLLGDPVIDLTLPEQPDLTINSQDVMIAPAAASEADSMVTIKIILHNWGLATADSFQVEVNDHWNDQRTHLTTVLVAPPLGISDSLTVPWKIANQAGQHTIQVVLDPLNQIAEADENNNSHSYTTYIYSSKISISKPLDFQVVPPQGVVLQVNNPAIAASGTSERYFQFELDTALAFNSPLRITSPLVAEGIIVTRWNAPDLLDQQTYFWRCRVIEGNETGSWVTASFTTNSVATDVTWLQKQQDQLRQNQFSNIDISVSGARLSAQSFTLLAESAGYADGNFARISINSVSVVEQHRGHNVVVVSPSTGQALMQRSFDTWLSQDEANALANFINSQQNGVYILAAIKDEGSVSMTEAAYQALESIGSQYCRMVGIRDSWAIIGKKGAPIGSVVERHSPRGQGVAVAADTMINYPLKGSIISLPIGPAKEWSYLSWNEDCSASGSAITLDMFGYNKKTSSWDTLFTNLVNNNKENLHFININTRRFPLIKLQANLSDDDGLDSPFLKNWSVSYVPVPDLAISAAVVRFNADSVLEGAPINIGLDLYNVGLTPADSVVLRYSCRNATRDKKYFGAEATYHVGVDSMITIREIWSSAGNAGVNQIEINIDPDDRINELSELNNYCSKQVNVTLDSTRPEIKITFDDKAIADGEYVAARPSILVHIHDNSPLSIHQDTTKVLVLLDGVRASFARQHLVFLPLDNTREPSLKAIVLFTPNLTDGDHALEVFVRDATGNSGYQVAQFKVVNELQLLHVLNYPNPFADHTYFTYFLTQPVDVVTIKIYTIAGRFIREIGQLPGNVGFNSYFWNGLDQDYDVLANGVYLYKIIARTGDRQVEQITKLVVMR